LKSEDDKPRQSCQVARPPWYDNNTMFKPIKDWTDQELADEHEICRAKMKADSIRAATLEESGEL